MAIKENIRVEGKHDARSKVMTTLFALFAEVERDLISERTLEGFAKARSSGTKLGRPKGLLIVSRLDGKENEIRHFLNLGVSKSAIARIIGVSRPTLYNFISTRDLKPSRQRGFLHKSGQYPNARKRSKALPSMPAPLIPQLPRPIAVSSDGAKQAQATCSSNGTSSMSPSRLRVWAMS